MKKLPETWFVDIRQHSASQEIIDKFKKWFKQESKGGYDFSLKYYGKDGNMFFCWDYAMNIFDLISLEEWHDCVFGEQFEKGEAVLVRDNDWKDTKSWVTAIFITEFEGKFVVDWDEQLYYFDQCKKKPSELDIKIEELKKFAEEKGVKLTVIVE